MLKEHIDIVQDLFFKKGRKSWLTRVTLPIKVNIANKSTKKPLRAKINWLSTTTFYTSKST